MRFFSSSTLISRFCPRQRCRSDAVDLLDRFFSCLRIQSSWDRAAGNGQHHIGIMETRMLNIGSIPWEGTFLRYPRAPGNPKRQRHVGPHKD
jgi:hypothetical protein